MRSAYFGFRPALDHFVVKCIIAQTLFGPDPRPELEKGIVEEGGFVWEKGSGIQERVDDQKEALQEI